MEENKYFIAGKNETVFLDEENNIIFKGKTMLTNSDFEDLIRKDEISNKEE